MTVNNNFRVNAANGSDISVTMSEGPEADLYAIYGISSGGDGGDRNHKFWTEADHANESGDLASRRRIAEVEQSPGRRRISKTSHHLLSDDSCREKIESRGCYIAKTFKLHLSLSNSARFTSAAVIVAEVDYCPGAPKEVVTTSREWKVQEVQKQRVPAHSTRRKIPKIPTKH
ncbi:hypothetical protein C8J57DRAFT_1224054 [Mycena rebaudengoi]|nr:hypothetical protein C8J57DRAFT_1224054 [Mycena rebaudengoi]